MKQNVHITSLCLFMALALSACGKKAKDRLLEKNNPGQAIETNLIVETHKELQAAIISGDLVKVKKLLELKSQIDLNKNLEDGETLMTTAVTYNRFQIVELLVENNASIYRTNARKETPLMVSAKLGFEDLLKLFISMGAKTDNKDLEGNTALHLSILGKFETVSLYLINSKTNIDITNNDNETALKLAEKLNLKNVVALLRSLTQSSVGLPDKMTVRNMAILGDVETLNRLFIKFPTLLYEYKDINFYVLVIRSHAHDKALSMVHLLMSYGVNLNGPVGADSTPLIESVKKNYEDFVALLLKENTNPNGQDEKGKTALIWAI